MTRLRSEEGALESRRARLGSEQSKERYTARYLLWNAMKGIRMQPEVVEQSGGARGILGEEERLAILDVEANVF